MSAKKFIRILIMTFLISSSFSVFGQSIEIEKDLKDSVILLVNSNIAYSKNTATYIDTSNKEVKAIVKNGRTLVPLRFISENFGAEVSFENETKTAIINFNNSSVRLTSNDKTMLIDEKKVEMDEPAQIINDRMLVPLRALAENALGKEVFYDNGLIVISEAKINLSSTETEKLIAKFNVSELPSNYQLSEPEKGDMIAVMKTNHGDIKIKLFYEEAPLAVENFVRLSQSGYYDGLIFHRVINNFMIQGGDPEGTGRGGESIWGRPFIDEISSKLNNIRGALSMANRGPNTNGSQFFIVQNPVFEDEMKERYKSMGMDQQLIDLYSKIGGTPWLDGKHTVFGQVYEGLDIVDNIAAVEVGINDKPIKDVKILTIHTYRLGDENEPIVFEDSADENLIDRQKAPEFELENAEGNKVKLSDLKGQIVVLNFWATWCPPCKVEMPDFNKVAEEFSKSNDATLQCINIGEEKDVVTKFLKDNGYTMNIILDTKSEVALKYNILAIPTTIVIDKEGNIADEIVGTASYEKVMEMVNNLK